MERTMIIKSLKEIPFDTLFKGFSVAFEDYDFQINYGQFKGMLKRRGYDPTLSFAAFNGNEIVSFVLNGIGDFNEILTAYDTGTGTAKEYRGKGLITDVFEFSVPYLKNAGIKQYLLEVLQHNEKAISLYKKQGFEVTREFDYFFQDKDKITVNSNFTSVFTIKEILIEDNSQISTYWDFLPSWQNSLDSVKRAGDGFVSLGAYDGENLVGYCIFEICSGDITQLAVKKEYRRKGAATSLLNEILKHTKADKIGIVNTDSTCDSFKSFLKSKKIILSGKQFEMIKEL